MASRQRYQGQQGLLFHGANGAFLGDAYQAPIIGDFTLAKVPTRPPLPYRRNTESTILIRPFDIEVENPSPVPYAVVNDSRTAVHTDSSTQIPGFTILRTLGKGGMARVYLASDDATGKLSAILMGDAGPLQPLVDVVQVANRLALRPTAVPREIDDWTKLPAALRLRLRPNSRARAFCLRREWNANRTLLKG
ncbi:MAG: hypothetical protein HOI95_05905 [Chromatiales bacterium]|nr:hypothetical protein [Chromatiales bacterium]